MLWGSPVWKVTNQKERKTLPHRDEEGAGCDLYLQKRKWREHVQTLTLHQQEEELGPSLRGRHRGPLHLAPHCTSRDQGRGGAMVSP